MEPADTASGAMGVRARRLATAIVISRIRWLFIPLALVGVTTNVPPPVNLPLFLATIALVIGYNTALTFHSRLPHRFVQPLIAVAMFGDVLMVAVTMLQFAHDPTDLGWSFLLLVGPTAAVLYGYRGVLAFVPPMLASLLGAAIAGDQLSGPNGVVGFLHKGLEVVGLAVIVAALAEQNERQRARVEQVNSELERLTVRDPLTGVANRRLFETRWKEERQRSVRSGAPVSIAIADIDHFKRVNDTFGHPAGDEVLREVATTMLANVRGIDLLARIGGEEFAVILPDTDQEGAQAFAERIRLAVEAITFEAIAVRCTVSIGLASGTGVELDDLVVAADRALYQAKAGGRNRIETWRAEGPAMVPPSRSTVMRQAFASGRTVADVARELGVSHRVAHGVYRRWQLAATTAASVDAPSKTRPRDS